MPTYEYKCKSCEKITEKRLSVEERVNPVKCEECGKETERIASIPSPAHFAGSGWTPKFHK